MDCIIIDDDQLSVKVLEEFINKTDGLTLKASFLDAVEARNYLSKNSMIDLIFLDIEMPEMSGFDLLGSLIELPLVIITSSKQKYAIDAFDFEVTDYLLKPIDYKKFYRAFSRAKKHFDLEKVVTNDSGDIFVKKGSNLLRLKFSEILWIEALENYVVFNTHNSKITIHFTMKAIEEKFPSPHFSRVHRSYIVNTKSISIIKENTLEIKYGRHIETIPIGKSFKEGLLKDINLITR